MQIDVAISGGSVEGICTSTGFLKAVLNDLGHEIVAASGNSAGGIILGAYAAGRDIDWIEKTVLETDFRQFASVPKWYQFIEMIRIFKRGWISDGKKLEEFLNHATFGRKMKDSRIDLYIVGADFTRRSLAVFSKRSEPDMDLWQAMRITSCLPGGFKPYTFRDRIYYDGGVRRHYPIDVLPISDRPIYGYLLGHTVHSESAHISDSPGLLGTLGDYIENAVDANVHDAMERSREVRMRRDVTIAYDDVKVSSLDFGISRDEKARLIETARQLTLREIGRAL